LGKKGFLQKNRKNGQGEANASAWRKTARLGLVMRITADKPEARQLAQSTALPLQNWFQS
jgi:hypothetical protein